MPTIVGHVDLEVGEGIVLTTPMVVTRYTVTGLPDPQPNTIILANAIVCHAATEAGRTDVFCHQTGALAVKQGRDVIGTRALNIATGAPLPQFDSRYVAAPMVEPQPPAPINESTSSSPVEPTLLNAPLLSARAYEHPELHKDTMCLACLSDVPAEDRHTCEPVSTTTIEAVPVVAGVDANGKMMPSGIAWGPM